MTDNIRPVIRLALPKGSMQQAVYQLLGDAGVEVGPSSRAYRPPVGLAGFEAKLLKPQNIVEMLHHGSRDIGFAGADWVAELDADLVELLDTELDPVRIVAAVPKDLASGFFAAGRRLIVASEYERLAKNWIRDRKLQAEFVRSYGATEVFPPEDADCIVDNTASGQTLAANGLVVVDELMTSSTRLYANPRTMEDLRTRREIEDFVLILKSVLEARSRVMLEVNVTPECLESLIEILPCMREPTISPLHGNSGYAVKAAVLKRELPRLIPEIKTRGGTDIVVTAISQVVW